MRMRDFLFRKDLWILDTVSVLCVAFCLGYVASTPSLIKDDSVWISLTGGCISAFCYFVALILALHLRERYTIFSSWVWLGIVGALVPSLVFWFGRGLPNTAAYNIELAPSVLSAVIGIGKEFFVSVGVSWLIWTIAGCSVIFTVRFAAFLLLFFSGKTTPVNRAAKV